MLRFAENDYNVIEREETCPVCQKLITCDLHQVICSKMRYVQKLRHDNTTRYVVLRIRRSKRPNIVSLKAGNMPANRIDKKEPDIYFEIDGK